MLVVDADADSMPGDLCGRSAYCPRQVADRRIGRVRCLEEYAPESPVHIPQRTPLDYAPGRPRSCSENIRRIVSSPR
jgi:hypothetical protein